MLISVLKYAKPQDIPAVVVSNLVYSSAVLNLELKEHLSSIVVPVIKEKAKYLPSDNLIELIWGLKKLGFNDSTVIS
jgi:hypothetical protein